MSPDSQPNDVSDDFKIWVDREPSNPNCLFLRGATIGQGRDALKTALFSIFGNPDTGEVKRRQLRLRTHQRRINGPGWAFDEPDPKTTWWCEGDQIERLIAFLNANVTETGRFILVDKQSPTGSVLELLKMGGIDGEALADGLAKHGNPGEMVRLLAQTGPGLSAAEMAVVHNRRDLVRKLQRLVKDPSKTEPDVQRLIGKAYWLFGGRYVGVGRRNLIPMDQHDIPLMGADGTLHIVELKGPNIRNLVRVHRNHWIVGDDVHEAVGQAMNYLRAFDELGAALKSAYENELGQPYDMRRVFATVVIGHPQHVKAPKATEQVVQQTIRSYNSHLTRIEVMTYKDVADTAERALAFEEVRTDGSSPAEPNARTIPSTDPWEQAVPSWIDDDIERWSTVDPTTDEPPF